MSRWGCTWTRTPWCFATSGRCCVSRWMGPRGGRCGGCWNPSAMSALAAQRGFSHHTAEPVMPLDQLLADEYTAAVLHFAGPVKPWQDEFPLVPLRQLYRRFLPAPALAGAR